MNKLERYLQNEGALTAALSAPDSFDAIVRDAAYRTAADNDNKSGAPAEAKPSKKRGRLWIGAGLAAAAVISLVVLLPTDGGGGMFNGLVSIEALAATDNGIDAKEGFLITATEPLEEDAIKEALVTDPYFEYELQKQSATSYKVIPNQQLKAGTIYTLKLDPQQSAVGGKARAENSWAFQTVAGFELVTAIPYDATTGAPTQSSIELEFSSPADATAADANISIEPQVKGTWQADGNYLTFIPKDGFTAATLYSVTIKATMASADGEQLGTERVIRFETAAATDSSEEKNQFFAFSADNNAFPTSVAPAFYLYDNRWYHGYYYAGSGDIFDLDCTVYRFKNAEAYAAALLSRMGDYAWCAAPAFNLIDLKGLEKTLEATIAPQVTEDSYLQKTLTLPEALPKGYYLLDAKSADSNNQVLFQVTDLLAYTSYDDNEALIWLHTTDGAAAAGASVKSLYGKSSTAADSDGVALLALKDEGKKPLALASSGDNQVLLSLQNTIFYDDQSKKSSDIINNYWLSLTTDRSLYRSGDTVNFFGIAAPRRDGVKDLSGLILRLNWVEGSDEVAVSLKDGCFDGQLTLPALTSDWYSVGLYYDDICIASSYFSVEDYVKPAYEMSATCDKQVVMRGDQVRFTAATAYFEGTALPDQDVNYQGRNISPQSGVITTDDEGKAAVTLTLGTDRDEYVASYLYGSAYLSFSAHWPELGEVSKDIFVNVIHSDLELNGKAAREEGSYLLTLDPYAIDLSKIDQSNLGDRSDWMAKIKAEYKGNTPLSVALYRVDYIKQESNYYDEYLKRNATSVYYDRREVLERSDKITLSGSGEQLFKGSLNSDNAYVLKVSGKDSAGRDFNRTYSVQAKDGGYGYPGSGDYSYLYFNDDSQVSPKIGDTVNLTVWENDSPLEVAQGGEVLALRYLQDVEAYQVSDANAYSFKFDEDYIPSIGVGGCYFDGHSYHAIYDYNVIFDYAERSLNLDIAPDKDFYAPGDEVALNLKLTDKDGKAVAGYANICLVDEALLSLADQYINLPQTIFGVSNQTYFNKQQSYDAVTKNAAGMGAEGGGEGDGGRSDFRDTALFTTVKLDANGQGVATFTMPDNITSWRVTYQAYRADRLPDIYVGSGTTSIAVSQDFFVDLRLGSLFLSGDQPMIGLRAVGKALDNDRDTVNYQLTATNGLTADKTVRGQLSRWLDIKLDALQKGDYTLTAAVTVDGKQDLTDKITLPFSVVDTRANHQVIVSDALSFAYQAPAGEAQTTLFFSNRAAARGIWGLLAIASEDNIRVEQRITSILAKKLLLDEYGINYWHTDTKEAVSKLIAYQERSGGIKPFTYSDANLKTSVLAVSAMPEAFEKACLISYFENQSTGDQLTRSYALWGLAALKQPVLNDIATLYAEEGLAGEVQLNIAMALYFAGDGKAAKDLAQQIINTYSVDTGSARRAAIGVSAEEISEATARLALLAAAYELPEADALWQYLEANPGQRDRYLIERYLILEAFANSTGPEASFSYSLDGQTTEVDLTRGLCHFISVTADKASSLSFSKVEGDVVVTASYLASGLPQPNSEAEKELSLSRRYAQDGKTRSILQQGEEVSISINYEIDAAAPNGYYNICDFLPAGLSFVRVDYDATSDQVWLSEEDGGKQVFNACKTNKYAPKGTIVYRARVNQPGSYKAEGAYIQHLTEQAFCLTTDSQTITIK